MPQYQSQNVHTAEICRISRSHIAGPTVGQARPGNSLFWTAQTSESVDVSATLSLPQVPASALPLLLLGPAPLLDPADKNTPLWP